MSDRNSASILAPRTTPRETETAVWPPLRFINLFTANIRNLLHRRLNAELLIDTMTGKELAEKLEEAGLTIARADQRDEPALEALRQDAKFEAMAAYENIDPARSSRLDHVMPGDIAAVTRYGKLLPPQPRPNSIWAILSSGSPRLNRAACPRSRRHARKAKSTARRPPNIGRISALKTPKRAEKPTKPSKASVHFAAMLAPPNTASKRQFMRPKIQSMPACVPQRTVSAVSQRRSKRRSAAFSASSVRANQS